MATSASAESKRLLLADALTKKVTARITVTTGKSAVAGATMETFPPTPAHGKKRCSLRPPSMSGDKGPRDARTPSAARRPAASGRNKQSISGSSPTVK